MDYNKAYKEVFGKGLESHGFCNIKKTKYFGRLLNGEIFQMIYCEQNPRACYPGLYKVFQVFHGTCSIYYEKIDFKTKMFNNKFLCEVREPLDLRDDGIDYADMTFSYHYEENEHKGMGIFCDYTIDTLENELVRALNLVTEYLIPKLDEVNNMKSYSEHISRHFGSRLYSPLDEFGSDFLAVIVSENRDDIMEECKKWYEHEVKHFLSFVPPREPENTLEHYYDLHKKSYLEPRERVFNDPKLHAAALAEAEQRKISNLETLRSYGVKV